MSGSSVLLCVHDQMPEVPAVAAALRDRWGVDPVLLDPSGYPTAYGLTLGYAAGAFACGWPDPPPMRPTAVWQGVHVGSQLPALDPDTRRTCVAASEVAMVGLLDSLDVFQLDPYWSAARAENKPYQLRLAPAFGLEVPQTIVTNDPGAVRALAGRAGPLVTKMLVQPAMSGSGETPVVFTSALTEADLADLDGLSLCPMIFQERVESALDVRVTIAGKRVFSASIDASARSEVDWRDHHARGGAAWTPCDLPPAIAGGLIAMLDHLGLNHGAFDLLVTPEGRHVFLELNPSGSFWFLGPELAAPIASAIADLLVDPGARRVPERAPLRRG